MSAPKPEERDPETAERNRERFQRVAEEEETQAAREEDGNLPGGKPMPREPRLEREPGLDG